jgi:hypothetical protein
MYVCIYPASKAHAPYSIAICGHYAITVFFNITHKWHDIRKKVTEYKICVLIFTITFSKLFLVLRRIQSDIIIKVLTP